MSRPPTDTAPRKDVAVLFGAAGPAHNGHSPNGETRGGLAEPLAELAGLADAAGLSVAGRLTQRIDRPVPATYIGSGKVEELKQLARARAADIVLADVDLSPAQARNLTRALGVRVVDRSELIMDIFARRARSGQAKVQVELAQLQYALPRLRGEWSHLDRYRGGGVGTRGPGEKQLETDRRLVRKRIGDLKRQLEVFEKRTRLTLRGRSGARKVALAGYTNSGKSTLFNALTGADRYAADRLFATLDTRTRRWVSDSLGETILSDTVGFIRDLPHHLVASFHATLEEVIEADLVLHVIDASDPDVAEHYRAARAVMASIDADDIPTIIVANKIDLVPDSMDLQAVLNGFPGCVAISAREGRHLDDLEQAVRNHFAERARRFRVTVPLRQGRVLARIRQLGEVVEERVTEDVVEYLLRVGQGQAGVLRALADSEGLALHRA